MRNFLAQDIEWLVRRSPPPLPSIERIREEVDARRDRDGREIAARMTRGNVAIQNGAFLTKADLERERDVVRRYRFP